jgi:hypothetical protein
MKGCSYTIPFEASAETFEPLNEKFESKKSNSEMKQEDGNDLAKNQFDKEEKTKNEQEV